MQKVYTSLEARLNAAIRDLDDTIEILDSGRLGPDAELNTVDKLEVLTNHVAVLEQMLAKMH